MIINNSLAHVQFFFGLTNVSSLFLALFLTIIIALSFSPCPFFPFVNRKLRHIPDSTTILDTKFSKGIFLFLADTQSSILLSFFHSLFLSSLSPASSSHALLRSLSSPFISFHSLMHRKEKVKTRKINIL